ncbi:MAG: hypothetical protein WAL25_13520 [Acidimicrobiia bacterium]
MTPWRIGAAWMAVLVVTTMLTWQIVSFADSQVSARPVEVAVSSSTTVGGPTTTTHPGSSSSSSSPTTSLPDSSTTSSSPSTSSTSVSSWSVRSVTTAGGTVVIRYRPEEVELQAATPAPGFDVELKDSGPRRVRVEFESEESDIRVEAEWRDGDLDVTVSSD